MTTTITTVARPAAPVASFMSWMPWTDRAGRLSWFKLVVFVAILAPVAVMCIESVRTPNAVAHVLRETGVWSMRMLVATLFVAPLRRITRWTRAILIRRMLGLGSLFYAAVHMVAYFFDQGLRWGVMLKDAFEVAFLSFGWIAMFGLVALGVTANEISIRKLGSRAWNYLHMTIYLIAFLSILHFLLEIHVDADEVAIISGLFVMSLLFRLLHRLRFGDGFRVLLVLAPVCGFATAAAEVAYFRWWTGVDWRHVRESNWSLEDGLRPGWVVLVVGLAVAIGGMLIRHANETRRQPKRA